VPADEPLLDRRKDMQHEMIPLCLHVLKCARDEDRSRLPYFDKLHQVSCSRNVANSFTAVAVQDTIVHDFQVCTRTVFAPNERAGLDHA
jgi:hypothetical protein